MLCPMRHGSIPLLCDISTQIYAHCVPICWQRALVSQGFVPPSMESSIQIFFCSFWIIYLFIHWFIFYLFEFIYTSIYILSLFKYALNSKWCKRLIKKLHSKVGPKSKVCHFFFFSLLNHKPFMKNLEC